MDVPTKLREVTLADKYTLRKGAALLSGTQALVRLLLEQHARDADAGLNTAGFVSGYRGSPLGGYDQALWGAGDALGMANIVFQPGVNEDLAATAVWGTQQAPLLPGCRYDGVFALWYGKGPGVDRSGDPIKHGNRMGTSRHGGVLLAVGDDHPGKSSTVAHQSEQALAANGVPVLYPASVQEIIDLGLHGFALSRFSGLWVALKCVNETVESTATVTLAPDRPSIVQPPDIELPPEGLHGRLVFAPAGDERRLVRYKLPAAQAYVRANRLDRAEFDHAGGLGIVTAGKAYSDVMEALRLLGIDRQLARSLGVDVYKVAMIWPLEPSGVTDFARGRSRVLVVEEKDGIIEPQLARALFNLPHEQRPCLVGKHDEHGAVLISADESLAPMTLAHLVIEQLVAIGVDVSALRARLPESPAALQPLPPAGVRVPYFCAGCPHNTSTHVPEGSLAMSGIGCHTMAIHMERDTLPPTHMGGEGMNWTGIQPFTDMPHVFQNLGDGTYFHSGLLAIRGAVTAGVNITYKLLVNDAVAMTGGQPVEGGLGIGEIARQLLAERVAQVVVVSDAPERHRSGLPAGVEVFHRDRLMGVQAKLRDTPGVTALIYEQGCAAEKRRHRKRGTMPEPDRRVFINPLVCEGCGDCSVKSNCVAVEPEETELGRKRRIDQAACNKDYSCVKGFCPSFLLIDGGQLRRGTGAPGAAAGDAAIPEPPVTAEQAHADILLTGVGGTGVVTVGALLCMAAHLEGRSANVFDMTGLAQKGGAVYSHIRIAAAGESLAAARIPAGTATLVLGCDLVVTASDEALATVTPGLTHIALNMHRVPTAGFQRDPDIDFATGQLLERIQARAGAQAVAQVEATRAATQLTGNALGANLFLLGFALQRGWVPVSSQALRQAIELNGVAVQANLRALALGRRAAHEPDWLDAQLGAPSDAAAAGTSGDEEALARLIEHRAAFLTDYQNAAYAQRYRQQLERVRESEQKVSPGSVQLTDAVARTLFRLMAYKDEYEVARLHLHHEARARLEGEFEGDYRVRVLLAPPLLARRDADTGEPRKIEFGSWIFAVFRPLAALKILRGTWLDPFGYTAERRMERGLIRRFEQTCERIAAGLNPDTLPVAVELARLPFGIRGFGHVKQRNLSAVDQQWRELLQRFEPDQGRRDTP
ncbi:MAG: indolepyruvate ferredoxin oxidoreductase family protein [Gammaproteobacteria bacterium]|nr:indolepyruvate ferredoxin oxidoreductase family protein [Gammaproteobacteria bacterium]